MIGKFGGISMNCRVAPNPHLAASNNSSHFYKLLFLLDFVSQRGRKGFCCGAGSLRQTDNSTTILFVLHQVGVSPSLARFQGEVPGKTPPQCLFFIGQHRKESS
ncbi:hypothetical protein [Cupriavidus taiwanensis]|uniref:hypothetical protein n=1 Tax=Cupriavidus taiwanensis TaxID=164546 RepID=UPI0011C02B18|nr:hypothetical protein [Cupriavidus taiwanensis]